MRKAFILAVGLVSLGASTELAMARQATCGAMARTCMRTAGFDNSDLQRHCDQTLHKCMDDGSWGNVAGPGSFRKRLDFTTSKGSAGSAAPPVVRDHRNEAPKTGAASSPQPTAAAGTAGTTPPPSNGTGPVVRDHRPGGNSAGGAAKKTVTTAKVAPSAANGATASGGKGSKPQ